ncbi:MAG: FTR1 family protein [Cyanobacteria bacterium SID2]|nr:FTR1 family protein [Cyanobacteria bacterium SID2]MBP0004564.1 FTR1 family protein [Cyanobacteria bacterium SBC]
MNFDFTAALPTFVITLREGFEAALVIGVVLSCLKKAQQTQLNSWVFSGVGAGIVASALVGWAFHSGMQALRASNQAYAPVIEPLLAGALCLVAIVMLSWMLLWMTQQARSLKADVEGAVESALRNSQAAGWGVFALIFIAVLREGFEAVIFIVAKFQQGLVPALGALGGLVGAAMLGVLLFQWGVKIDVRRFFQVMGVLLLLIVSGLVVAALKDVNEAVEAMSQLQPQFAHWCNPDAASCVLGSLVWDTHEVLPDKQFPGILLKSLMGYRDRIYAAQAIGYTSFLSIAGWLYFQSLGGRLWNRRSTLES